MADLPPGWWVKNSAGTFVGPAAAPEQPHDSDNDDSSETSPANNEPQPEGLHGLDIEPDSPGWEDMEPDTETVSVQCLLCSEQFSSPATMLDHSKAQHSFDFVSAVKDLHLDFYLTIKYINCIRSRVRSGESQPEKITGASLESDEWLRPVLENDALLFSLDDVIDFDMADAEEGVDGMAVDSQG